MSWRAKNTGQKRGNMNKKYALEIIEMVPKMLEKSSPLAREACNYLMRLIFNKKHKTQADNELYDKCYSIKYNSKS
jgi:hypothetical protein